MKGGLVIFLVLVIALAYSVAVQSQVNPEIDDLFGNNDEIGVIVVLKDDYDVLQEYGISNYKDKDDFEMKKMMISEQQEHVLADLKLKKKNKGLSAQTDEEHDFELANTYTTVNGFAGKLKKSSYQKLKNNPNVLRIYKQKNITLFLSDSAGIINATRTWSLIYSGNNVTGKYESVCVIDTGIDYTHPALGSCSASSFTGGTCSKVIGGYDFFNNDNDPIDDNGHGTHVAGIVASTNETYRGIAPDANIIAIKVLNASGDGSDANLISGIDWCVNNASKFNISVISMSLGSIALFTSHCDNDNTLLTSSIANAIARNISVVAATGNADSTTGIASPACVTNVTAVGGTTKSDAIDFNRNNLIDLLAPGVSITSTKLDGGFETLSGTSMATPHVSGAFALLRQYKRLEQNRVLTPLQIQDALNDTGKQIDDTTGSGFFFSRINVFSALLSLDTTKPGITLVNPTPANGTNLSLNSTDFFVYISASTTEVLSSAILEINNGSKINISMTINGLNSFINLTSLRIGARTFKVYGNDSAGNSNITDLRVFQINNTAPKISAFAPSNEFVDIVEPNNQTFSINFSDNENDTITFHWYLNNSLQLSGINKNEFNFTGNFTASGVYVINATLDDGAVITYKRWNLNVSNANIIPTTTSANLTNTDFLNRTNGTLQAFWSFNDTEGDSITANETMWYINNTLISNYSNKTFIHPVNTTKFENWTFSVRVFDGLDWSDFANSSAIKILNAKPSINITAQSITILETQLANISLNASDLDNDPLTFTSNKSEFVLADNALLWYTNLTNNGVYAVNVSVNDSLDIDSVIVNVTVINSRDLDNDGNPDFNDTDIDNDGVSNQDDYLAGNLSSINTTLALSFVVNGTSNLSKLFNGTFIVNITNGSDTFIEFNFTFNSSNILDLGNLTINRTTNGSSAVSIRGLRLTNTTKTVFLEKINTTVKAVCIKDVDASFDSISSSCDSANETLMTCDNATGGQYVCFDTGTRYKITGLGHSAVKEECRDNDGDGFGNGCAAGIDNCDTDASTSGSCPSGGGGGGGSSGGSGGGGGGGGGGGAFFVCNQDWQCGEWSNCVNGLQTRQCDFVKVAQHVQDTECPSSLNAPASSQKCEASKKLTSLAAGACDDGIKNQKEEGIDCGGVCKPCEEKKLTIASTAKKEEANQLTGFAVRNITGKLGNTIFALSFIAIVIILVIVFKLYRHKQQKQ